MRGQNNKSMKTRKKSAVKSSIINSDGSSLERDQPKNVLANNRKILTSAANATKSMPKNALLLINSNRTNAYKDDEINRNTSQKRKEVHTLEHEDVSDSKPIFNLDNKNQKNNYFRNHNIRKNDIKLNMHDNTQNLNKDISFKNFAERRRSDNVKNYYTPENCSTKQAKTNNYMIKGNDDSLARYAFRFLTCLERAQGVVRSSILQK